MSYPPPTGFQNNPNQGYPQGPGQGANYGINPMAPNSQTGQYPSYPYPNQSQTNPTSLPYPQGSTSSPYPGSAAYPPVPGNPTYPPSQSNSPYPGTQGISPYPNPAGGSPYPQGPGSSPYPPSIGNSPYPNQGNSSYPSAGGSPYPQGPGNSPYPPPQGTPYGSSSNYPSSTHGSMYPSATGASQYHSNTGQYAGAPPSTGSSPYGQPGHSSHGPGYSARPTVRGAMSFDPSSDAAALRKAMKGFGTDEKAIIQVLARRSCQQRQQIMMKYQQAYGRDLIKDLKSELSGDFETAILAVMTPLPKFLSAEIKRAIDGLGTKEHILIEILCSNDNNLIRAIKQSYHELYHCPMEKDIAGDTSGHFKKLLLSVCAAQRDEHTYNPTIAADLARSLYKAGEGRLGTNNEEFNRILASYSPQQLRLVFEEYQKIKGKTFESALKSELSGDIEDGMLAIYDSCMNRPGYFAKRFRSAMSGAGTRDQDLIRLTVSRSEIDLGTIKEEYAKIYGKTLESAITSETSGDYRKILLALLQD